MELGDCGSQKQITMGEMSVVDKYEVDNLERKEIAELVDTLLQEGDWEPFDAADRIAVAAQSLPAGVRRFLVNARMTESDVTVLSGLPVSEDLAPTPIGWRTAAETGAGLREEVMLMLCASVIGDPFAWVDQQEGRMVHDVCPAPGQERSLTSASSELPLSLHTEDVFHSCRGDYVTLLCLRNPDRVGTTYARITNLDVPDDVRRLLGETRFRFHPDDSHMIEGHDKSEPGSVVFGPESDPYLRFDVDFISALREGDTEVEEAIQVTQRSLAAAVERAVLAPGDLVFIDNYRVVHGREPFVPRYDGADRWLKRTNLIRDIRRVYSSSDRRSRLIA